MPYTDRVDYVAAMTATRAGRWREKLGGIEVPKRGEYCRVIAAELNRIASHLLAIGAMAWTSAPSRRSRTPARARVRSTTDRGALRRAPHVQLHAHRRRRVGLPPATARRCSATAITSSRRIHEMNDLLSFNKIYVERLADVRRRLGRMAMATTSSARTCAAAASVRRQEGRARTARIARLRLRRARRHGRDGTVGDLLGPLHVRINECLQSLQILRQCVQQIPDGPVICEGAAQRSSRSRRRHIRVEARAAT
jgi:NADH-quinone oxidoreductase subunit D